MVDDHYLIERIAEQCSRFAPGEPSYQLVGCSHYVDYHVHVVVGKNSSWFELVEL